MTNPGGATLAGPGSGRLVAALVVALALVTGLVLGVAVDRGLLRHRPTGAWSDQGARFQRRGPPSDRMQHAFATELGLSAAQMAQVDSIMTRQMGLRRALADTMDAKMRTLMDSTRTAVDRVLTPEQRQKLAAMRAHRDSARGPGRWRPPGRD